MKGDSGRGKGSVKGSREDIGGRLRGGWGAVDGEGVMENCRWRGVPRNSIV